MIGLMDCNNFFVSCERLFRPDLHKRPVMVLSSNDGCVVARSQEVKDLGVPMGAPYFEVTELCKKNHVTVFSSNFTLYRDISARVMTALREECGPIEVYSIDEAFFDVEKGLVEGRLDSIRANIIKKTGIPVSIGVATTKTLAKMANNIAKKGDVRRPTSNIFNGGEVGVCVMDDSLFGRVRSETLCGSVWGIGRETSAKLSAFNIKTVDDLLNVGLGFMRQQFGVHGERLFFELSGMTTQTYESIESAQVTISSTRSFAHSVRDRAVLESALGHHVIHVAEKLRERGMVASHLSIIAAPSRYGAYVLRKATAERELVIPTHDTTVLLKEALALLDTIYDPEIPYKKAGVTVSRIISEEYVSKSLFASPLKENQEGMYHTVDLINSRFGQGTVRPALMLGNGTWQDSKKLKSPEYTTKWTQIAYVKAI